MERRFESFMSIISITSFVKWRSLYDQQLPAELRLVTDD
ncbi:hypothetical protein GXM_08939 [Nostoc sphaeroides CCNUC1]|uniref:Uncharacterized protein n=1 Tax=Nostoc sphaeroides CCNUC1 TaxID=2653204 RepID=A0A5P8WF39_9NOSO|nr:hypothetical protein GXM_08939 [Nostoc sphaeroides CCNUC1]